MPNIDTGFELDGYPRDVPPGERRVLFGPDSPPNQLFSPRLDVRPGKAALVHAFGLEGEGSIFVRAVRPQSFKIGPGSSYSMDAHLGPVTLGGAELWALDAFHRQLLITLPGLYRLELSDLLILTETLLVEYFTWDAVLPGAFPALR